MLKMLEILLYGVIIVQLNLLIVVKELFNKMEFLIRNCCFILLVLKD